MFVDNKTEERIETFFYTFINSACIKNHPCQAFHILLEKQKMPQPGFEPGLPRPQRGVLTTILLRPGECGHRSRCLSHAKRALYHLS
jgi:hypothetical protein